MRYDAIDYIPITQRFEVIDMGKRIFTDEFVNHAISMFDGRRNLAAVARLLGTNADNLSKAIRAKGVTVPKGITAAPHRKNLPNDDIVQKYALGMSELELSKEYGISRTPIRRVLLASGVEIRDQSQASFVSAARLTADFRQKRAHAAHAAIRGKKRSHDECIRRAITASSGIDCRIGKGENEFAQLLDRAGITFDTQTRADIYNIDFVVGGIAVELKSGVSGAGSAAAEQAEGRIKKLVECGYRVIYVYLRDVDSMVAAFDQIVTEIDILRGLPSFDSQYRVVTCRLQDYAIVRNERHQFTRIPAAVQLHTTVRDFDI